MAASLRSSALEPEAQGKPTPDSDGGCERDPAGDQRRYCARSPIPISGGEQEYTRWGAQALIYAGAVDIVQPDVFIVGVISELMKIGALASVGNVQMLPHARANVSVHLAAALAPDVTPDIEDLIKSSISNEFFLKQPSVREHGKMLLPTASGLGMDLDPAKIESNEVLSFG